MNPEFLRRMQELLLSQENIGKELALLRSENEVRFDPVVKLKFIGLEKDLLSNQRLIKDTIQKNTVVDTLNSHTLVEWLADWIKALEVLKQRVLVIKKNPSLLKLEKSLVTGLLPVIQRCLSYFFEFSLESERERELRGKNTEVAIDLSIEAKGSFVVLKVECDGNGLVPPKIDESSFLLSNHYIKADYTSQAGVKSSWSFIFPISSLTIDVLIFKIAGQTLAVSKHHINQNGEVPRYPKNKEFHYINIKNLSLTKVDPSVCFGKNYLELQSGAKRINLVVDEVVDVQSVFIHELQEEFNSQHKLFALAMSSRLQADSALLRILDPHVLLYPGRTPESVGVHG